MACLQFKMDSSEMLKGKQEKQGHRISEIHNLHLKYKERGIKKLNNAQNPLRAIARI